MDSFAELKKNRKSVFDKLSTEINKMTQKVYDNEDGDRFWKPQSGLDSAGNNNAVIRFLPAPKGEDLPYVRYFEHSFQGPNGQYFIELCPTTIGKDCPVCRHNNGLWNSGLDSNKQLVSKQKRKLRFVSNILIIKDSSQPENEGEVKLFRYGKKIFDKINELMHPSFEDEEAVNPFDFWEGANFKLRIRTVEGYLNYDKSEFDKVKPLSDDDKYLTSIWEKEESLKAFVDPSLFKSESDLQAKLDRVLGAPKSNVIPLESAEPRVSKEVDVDPELLEGAKLDNADDEFNEDYFRKLAGDE